MVSRHMQIKVENQFGAVTEAGLAQFEARHQIALPEEYKQFLLQSNGGRPVPDVFGVPGWAHHSSSIHGFLGIHTGPDWQLERACRVYAERVPCDLMPIACDDFGNIVCLGIRGIRRGKIYFWDHENELDENGDFVQDYRNVFLVANSLQEFLDSLMTYEEFENRHPAKQT